MKLYVFDKNTKELIGEINGLLDPLESRLQGREIYVIPPFTTPIYPEKFEDGKVNVYNEEKKLWELTPDFRGKKVFDKKGNSSIISELGEIPEGFSLDKPYNFQEEKLNKIAEVECAYAEAYEEKVKIGKFNLSLLDLSKVVKYLEANVGSTFVTVDFEEPTIITINELQNIKKILSIRSLLLPIQRKNLIASIKGLRNKTQLDKFTFSYNINKEVEEKAKLSEEDFNKYIIESM